MVKSPEVRLSSLPPQSHRLVRGTVLNFLGQALPLPVGVVALPLILRGLGPERFGIFSISLAVLGAASQFDLGMPRATTKFLAELLGTSDHRKFRQTFWTSLLVQAFVGIIVGGLLLLLVPSVSWGVLKVSHGLIGEMEVSLVLMAASLPFVMLTSMAKGALDAGQHFGITNALRIPLSSIMYVIPAVALFFHIGLPGIFVWILMARVLLTALHLVFCFRVYGVLKKCEVDLRLIRPLLSFGGWVLVTGLVVAALTTVDRLLIGAIRTTAEVGMYSLPVDTLSRLYILPASFVTVLFPTFSGLAGDAQHMSRIFAQSTKLLILLMAPISVMLAIFARPILTVWLGPALAAQSTALFRVVALTVLGSSIGWIPYALLQAVGRPDIPARIALLESPFFVCALWLLIKGFGPLGAAIGGLIRAVVEVILFIWALWRIRPETFKGAVWTQSMGAFASALAVMLVSWPIASVFERQVPAQAVIFGICICAFGWVSWRKVLGPTERGVVLSLLSRRTAWPAVPVGS